MEKKLHDVMFENVEFVEIKEDVLTACMTTCMASHNGECEKKK